MNSANPGRTAPPGVNGFAMLHIYFNTRRKVPYIYVTCKVANTIGKYPIYWYITNEKIILCKRNLCTYGRRDGTPSVDSLNKALLYCVLVK